MKTGLIALLLIVIIIQSAIIISQRKKFFELSKQKQEKENEKEVDTTVKEIMTPRTSIFALDIEETVSENLNNIIEQGFSRIPVYKENIDNICGILYIKDLLNIDLNKKIGDLARKTVYVPETMGIYKMLDEFKSKQNHMAIIIDEYGGTSGIVTIEDILEEFVGEIRDEYDIEIDSIIKISQNIYDIQGDTLVEEIDKEISINIPVSEEYDTISGYVQYRLGKVAEENDQIVDENYILKVMNVDNKRIVKVRLILHELEGEKDE